MPDDASSESALRQLYAFVQRGKLSAAEDLARRLLQSAPEDSRWWSWLGFTLLLQGRFPESEGAYGKAVALNPTSADDWDNLSIAIRKQGRPEEAESYARRAVTLEESNANHWINLGAALADLQRWDEAATKLREGLARNPHDSGAWELLGVVESNREQLEAAQRAFEQSLALVPDRLETIIGYAGVLAQRGQPQKSLQLLERSSPTSSKSPSAWLVAGFCYAMLEDHAAAEMEYRRVLQAIPKQKHTLLQLAGVLISRWNLPEAETCASELLSANACDPEALILLSAIQLARGEVNEALASCHRAVAIEDNPVAHSKLLTAMQYADDVSPETLLVAHQSWNTLYAQPISSPPITSKPRSKAKPDNDVLRLGFLSADFCRHPISFLALPALECLDKSACSAICYSDRLAEDEYTARFRIAADTWRVTAGLTNEELTRQIESDEIDILFDLMGHVGKRLLVFAHRPAGLQVTWLGYVGTTGMSAIDALLADRIHVREEEDKYYVEHVLRMPNGYACFGAASSSPNVVPLPASEAGHVTIGCFNNPTKYAPSIVGAWAEILHRLPAARLLLKYAGLDDRSIQESLRSRFAKHGIRAERILMEGKSSHHDFLAAYNRIDLALDTQPYSGGLTTCEALWMGVPVITFPGQTFAGRHSASHLAYAGYPEFIASDLPGYIDLAVHWASRLSHLATIRSQMRDRVRTSPLCDAPTFARDLLTLLQNAYHSKFPA
jgi:protein O-GlcNAc transferase